MQARKATHRLDGQHQDVNRTLRGRVNQNDRRQRWMEKVRPWCGQPSDRGRLKNRTENFAFSALTLVPLALNWASGRASGLQKMSGQVLVWLSLWSEVHIVCIWSIWCHCHLKTTSSLAWIKPRLLLPFWCRLTQFVLEKWPLNGCGSSSNVLM